MVWGIDYLNLLFWVPSAWYKSVRSGDIKHLRAGTRVERVRSWRGVMAYASKYMGKIEALPDSWASLGDFGALGEKYPMERS